jgi:hypothetical protein
LWFRTTTQARFIFIGLEKALVMQVCFKKKKYMTWNIDLTGKKTSVI